MTREEFNQKLVSAQLSEEETTLCLYWFDECKGKRVMDVAEGDIDGIMINAKRFYGRMNAEPKVKKGKKVVNNIDAMFKDYKNLIEQTEATTDLNIINSNLIELINLVGKQLEQNKHKDIIQAKNTIDNLIKSLKEMGEDYKLVKE